MAFDFLFPTNRPQLDRIEAKLVTVQATLKRMENTMSQQEQDLNAALNDHFAGIEDGLARIEAKLAEAPDAVDLTDEIASLRASTDAFKARVDADVNPPEAPPE